MVAVTICSDFGAQEYKICHGFHFSPFYLPWNDGTMQIESENEGHSVMSDSLWSHGLYSPWNFPGQNTEVGNRSLLPGIFPTQGSNPCLLHCRWVLLSAVPPGKPKNTAVGSLSLLQGIFPPRNQTCIAGLCITGEFFTSRAIGEVVCY